MKSRILFLLQFPPPVHGSSLIGQRIAQSSLLSNKFDNTFINIATSRTMQDIGKMRVKSILIFIKVYFKIVFTLVKKKFNLCFFAITSSGIAFYRDILIIAILKLFRIKYILQMNNKGVLNNSKNLINNILYRYVFKKSNVIQNSEYLFNDISKYVSKQQVHILFNGIPQIEIKQQNKNTEEIKILYLANMTKSKGVYLLLEACKILKIKGYNFHCSFVGAWNDINEKQFNDFLKKNGIENQISYLGVKYEDDKYYEFNNADIFAFPTYYNYESFPLVLLEAMQFSLPVVSTYEGGIPDIVDNDKTGFLVPQQDVQALADKLEILIKDPELRKQMGVAGRKKYEEEFTLKRFEERLVEILKKSIE